MIWPILADPVIAGEPECKVPGDCDDANDCTDDSCEGGICIHAPVPDMTGCNDGDACTYNDYCDYGVCYGYPQWCTDNDDCTIDYCDPAAGCVNEPIDCEDGNPCTDDYCDSDSGQCVNEPNNNACDDGDPCTENDQCGEDGCVHGTPVQCPKGQVCDPAIGECVDECPQDLDGDGFVNASDLAGLLGAWGPNPGHPADFNGDNIVNAADLAQLLGAWGVCE